MGKVLLITNADMSLQSGNVVLVTRRAQELFRQFGIKTVCIIMASKKNSIGVLQNSESIEYILLLNKKQLEKHLNEYSYKIVIFYGTLSLLYLNLVKKKLEHKSKILLDQQAAQEEQFEYSKGIDLVVDYIKFYLKDALIKISTKNIDGVITVSDELSQYIKKYFSVKKRDKVKFFKIRCGINNVLTDDFRMKSRCEIRKKWGIADDTRVMVFSGYRLSWQKVDEIIKIFQDIDKKAHNVFFAFFCNEDKEFRNRLEKAFPKNNFILEFLSFEYYFKNLCACDIGFLVRDYNYTNKVAFPNKFSDYINAGLLIAINDALPEPMRILRQYKLIHIDINNEIDNILNKCDNRLKNLSEYYIMCNQVCKEELLFSRQIYKSKLGDFIMEKRPIQI